MKNKEDVVKTLVIMQEMSQFVDLKDKTIQLKAGDLMMTLSRIKNKNKSLERILEDDTLIILIKMVLLDIERELLDDKIWKRFNNNTRYYSCICTNNDIYIRR